MGTSREELDYLVARLVPLVLERLQAESTGVSEIEMTDSLDGIVSLPAIKRIGGTEKIVEVLIETLAKPVEASAEEFIEAAQEALAAAAKANLSAEGLDALKAEIRSAITAALEAADSVEAAVLSAHNAAQQAEAGAEDATAAATEVRDEVERSKAQVNEAVDTMFAQIDEFVYNKNAELGELASEMGAAKDAAWEIADHPTYIGADHYVYKWNSQTKAYDKTGIYTKGDAFSIKKQYVSIAAMQADYAGNEVKVGEFVIVNSADVEDPDNAGLYLKGEQQFDFIVDMSGMQGFTGKTPQLFIGEVLTGEAGSSVAVSLSEYGYDQDGNPRYRLNLTIPRGNVGKPLIVLPNGHYGNWNEETGEYIDSGVDAMAMVDINNVRVAFTEATEKEQLQSGESVPVLFGKVKKWLSSLGGLAWKNKADYTADIDNLPDLSNLAKIRTDGNGQSFLNDKGEYNPASGGVIGQRIHVPKGMVVADPSYVKEGTILAKADYPLPDGVEIPENYSALGEIPAPTVWVDAPDGALFSRFYQIRDITYMDGYYYACIWFQYTTSASTIVSAYGLIKVKEDFTVSEIVAHTDQSSAFWYVAAGNGLVVAAPQNYASTTLFVYDGITTTEVTFKTSTASNQGIFRAEFVNGVFVIFTGVNMYFSSTGATWSTMAYYGYKFIYKDRYIVSPVMTAWSTSANGPMHYDTRTGVSNTSFASVVLSSSANTGCYVVNGRTYVRSSAGANAYVYKGQWPYHTPMRRVDGDIEGIATGIICEMGKLVFSNNSTAAIKYSEDGEAWYNLEVTTANSRHRILNGRYCYVIVNAGQVVHTVYAANPTRVIVPSLEMNDETDVYVKIK